MWTVVHIAGEWLLTNSTCAKHRRFGASTFWKGGWRLLPHPEGQGTQPRFLMIISNRYPYEGPRTPTPAEDLDAAGLSHSIFFGEDLSPLEALAKWPMYLRPETGENSFVMVHQGQPVSRVVRLYRDIVVRGHALRIGFVGGVCTHPDHRENGLASTSLDATLQRFADDDVDFVYISGARPLYYKTGANHTGGFTVFLFTSDAAESLDTKGLNVRQASFADASILLSLNEAEETRTVRDLLDYELVLQHGYCCGGRCIFSIVELDSTPVAFVAARDVDRKEERWSQRILEFAGDREAIAAALGIMARGNGPNGHFGIEARAGDELTDRLSAMGLEPRPGRISGTVKIPSFTRTMDRLRPYFASHLGSSFAESLEFAAGKERYVAAGAGGVLKIDGESNMLWTLLGNPPEEQSENVHATGLMRKALEDCLPIPLPALYMNII